MLKRPLSTSWHAKPRKKKQYKNAPVRRRAATYADNLAINGSQEWRIAYAAFYRGWCEAMKERNLTLRYKHV